MKIFFIIPYPLELAPSQRFRFEHYLGKLEEHGIQYRVSSFFDKAAWNNIYRKGHVFSKVWATGKGFFRRIGNLFSLYRFDYVFVHREATPLGPAWFEWCAAKLFRKKLIYDFDDAIWIPFTSRSNRYIQWLRNFGKVKNICRWSHLVITGNDFLNSYAKKYNNNSIVIPTVVDTLNVHNRLKNQADEPVSIGWTGSFTTLKYLEPVLPALSAIQEKHPVNFIVIADRDPELKLPFYKFIKWTKETEVSEMMNFHIGLMPLVDDELAKGKCGFKAIQYMALGIPALVSPVGVNKEIVDDGKNGYVCGTTEEWISSITELLYSMEKRKEMGKLAREKIRENYSVTATQEIFLSIFRKK